VTCGPVLIAPAAHLTDNVHDLLAQCRVALLASASGDGFEIGKRAPVRQAVITGLICRNRAEVARRIKQAGLRQCVEETVEVGPLEEEFKAPALVLLVFGHPLDERLLVYGKLRHSSKASISLRD